jgi:hypothetical protein
MRTRLHRSIAIVATTAILGACAGANAQRGERGSGVGRPRLDLHCTPQHEGDEAACNTHDGYSFRPPLICRGVDVGPEVRERERRAYEAGTAPCECVSREQERQCMMVP